MRTQKIHKKFTKNPQNFAVLVGYHLRECFLPRRHLDKRIYIHQIHSLCRVETPS